MRLIDNPLSPYAMKIRIILYEKGLDFEKQEITEAGQHEELQAVNPRAEVPALVDGETVLYDSKVIAEYLEETYPETPLVPKDPAARGACRMLELYSDNELDSAVAAHSLFKFFRPELANELPEALERAIASVRRHFATLERRLGGQTYFIGEFSRADIAVTTHLATCAFLGLAPDDATPQLTAWHARMNERESVQRATQDAIASLGEQPAQPFFSPSRLQWRSDRIEQLIRIGLGPWLLDELGRDAAFLPQEP